MTNRHAERVRGERTYSLYAPSGARKYVNAAERTRFLRAADSRDPATRALCLMLVYTGCRLSEALNLTADAVQPDSGIIAIASLKKRRTGIVREVPVPDILIGAIRQAKENSGSDQIWPLSRTWSWTLVKRVMAQADITGIQATPKGLRHGFAIHAVECGIPLTLVQKWLGHAQLSTTAIYANAVGPEERRIAARMW
ncbi:tyrosine-type recombinase/integrase [Microbaculum marinum]|uniref:Tyrosine-type recombinase/integrase n=1 Tax=Microbaculum marinum TaxID=1764581 RepID=A0AAW9RKR2_9HYPH